MITRKGVDRQKGEKAVVKKRSSALARWLRWLEHHPVHQRGCGLDSGSGPVSRVLADPCSGYEWEADS